MKRRLTSFVLVLCVLLTIIPMGTTAAFAKNYAGPLYICDPNKGNPDDFYTGIGLPAGNSIPGISFYTAADKSAIITDEVICPAGAGVFIPNGDNTWTWDNTNATDGIYKIVYTSGNDYYVADLYVNKHAIKYQGDKQLWVKSSLSGSEYSTEINVAGISMISGISFAVKENDVYRDVTASVSIPADSGIFTLNGSGEYDYSVSGVISGAYPITYTEGADTYKVFLYVYDHGQCGTDAYWSFDPNREALTINGSGSIDDYTSSGNQNSAPWGAFADKIINVYIEPGITRIGSNNFTHCSNIENVFIAGSVEEIGSDAFGWCYELKNIELPANLTTIERGAFYWCRSLGNVTIPAGVSSIGENAFSRCKAMTSISVDAANDNYVSLDGVLYTKDMKTLVQYPTGKGGHYSIPDTVENIYGESFDVNDNITSLYIPASITSIKAPFSARNINSIDVDVNNPYYVSLDGVLYTKSMDTLVWYPSGKSGEQYRIASGTSIIGRNAFSGIYNRSSIVVPTSITEIEFIGSYNTGCHFPRTVYYEGSQSEWDAISCQTALVIPDITELILLNGADVPSTTPISTPGGMFLPAPQGLKWKDTPYGVSNQYCEYICSSDAAGYVDFIYVNGERYGSGYRDCSRYGAGQTITYALPVEIYEKSSDSIEVRIAAVTQEQFDNIRQDRKYLDNIASQLNYSVLTTSYSRPATEMDQVTNIRFDVATAGPIVLFDGIPGADSYYIKIYALISQGDTVQWHERGTYRTNDTYCDLSRMVNPDVVDLAVSITTISPDNTQTANSRPTEIVSCYGHEFVDPNYGGRGSSIPADPSEFVEITGEAIVFVSGFDGVKYLKYTAPENGTLIFLPSTGSLRYSRIDIYNTSLNHVSGCTFWDGSKHGCDLREGETYYIAISSIASETESITISPTVNVPGQVLPAPTNLRWINGGNEEYTFDIDPNAFAFIIFYDVNGRNEGQQMIRAEELVFGRGSILVPEDHYDTSAHPLTVHIAALTRDQFNNGWDHLNYAQLSTEYNRPADEYGMVSNVHWDRENPVVSWDEVSGAEGYYICIYAYVQTENGMAWRQYGSRIEHSTTSNLSGWTNGSEENLAVTIRTVSPDKNQVANSLPTERFCWKGDSGPVIPENALETAFIFDNGTPDLTIKKGETFTVSMVLNNNPGIVALQNSIVYDNTKLELLVVSNGSIISGMQKNSNLAKNPYPIVWNEAYSEDNITATGTMAVFTFRLLDNISDGEYYIEIVNQKAFDTNQNEVPTIAMRARVHAVSYMIGDVNNDGRVSMADADYLLKYLVEEDGYTLAYREAADLDGNNMINVNDAVVLLRHIAGWSGYEELPVGSNGNHNSQPGDSPVINDMSLSFIWVRPSHDGVYSLDSINKKILRDGSLFHIIKLGVMDSNSVFVEIDRDSIVSSDPSTLGVEYSEEFGCHILRMYKLGSPTLTFTVTDVNGVKHTGSYVYRMSEYLD